MIPNSATLTIPYGLTATARSERDRPASCLGWSSMTTSWASPPEGIVDSYPSLNTADVYSVLGYYLTNRDEVDIC
jgi:hypothetical protein